MRATYDYDVEVGLIGVAVGVDTSSALAGNDPWEEDDIEVMFVTAPRPDPWPDPFDEITMWGGHGGVPQDAPDDALPDQNDPDGFTTEHPNDAPEEECRLTQEETIAMAIAQEIARQSDSSSREYGAAIYQRADGSFRIGDLVAGPDEGQVDFDVQRLRSSEKLVSLIHNHPSGSGLSQKDWTTAHNMVAENQAIAEDFNIYLVHIWDTTIEVFKFDYIHDRNDRSASENDLMCKLST